MVEISVDWVCQVPKRPGTGARGVTLGNGVTDKCSILHCSYSVTEVTGVCHTLLGPNLKVGSLFKLF